MQNNLPDLPSKWLIYVISKPEIISFPGGSDGKASVCKAGEQGSIPGSGGRVRQD